MKKILTSNGRPLVKDGKVFLSSNNSGSDESGTAYEELLEIIGTKADVAYVEQVRQEIYDKYDNTTAGPTPASQVMFDDGVSLAEKYLNGELGGGDDIETYQTVQQFNTLDDTCNMLDYTLSIPVYVDYLSNNQHCVVGRSCYLFNPNNSKLIYRFTV